MDVSLRPARYSLLDLWRGFASVHILMFHLLEPLVGTLGGVADFVVRSGPAGTDAFFVVSGFGMAAAVRRVLEGRGTRREFLQRRLLRIYTLHAWAFVFAAWVLPAVVRAEEYAKGHHFVTAFPALTPGDVIGFLSLARVFSATGWELNRAFLPLNGVLWFIAVIVQFYVVVGIVMTRRRVWYATVWALSALSLLCHWPPFLAHVPPGLFLPLWIRAAWGILLYEAIARRWTLHRVATPILLALVAGLVTAGMLWLLGRDGPHRTLEALWLASLFWVLHPLSTRRKLWPQTGYGSSFAGCSYSVYLMHLPLWPLAEAVARNVAPGMPAAAATILITLPATWLMAYVWYLYFERPATPRCTFHALRRPWPVLRAGLADLARGRVGATAGFGGVGSANNGCPPPPNGTNLAG